MKISPCVRIFLAFLLFSLPVFADDSAQWGADFDEKIFSYGAEFSKQYNDFLYKKDFSILQTAAQNVKTLADSYTSSREYKRIAEQSRDFRYLFERIDADIAWIFQNGENAEDSELQFFASDLLQTLLKLGNYRTAVLNQYQEERFSKAMRNGMIVAVVLLCVILLLVIWMVLLKNRILSKEYEKKQSEAFAQAVFQAQEDERNRISNELHDTVAQEIRAIRLKAEMGETEEVADLATHCMNEMRSICYNLMPPDLKLANGTARIETIFSFLCTNFESQNGIPCAFSAQEDLHQISDQKILLNLFRIVQEALNNAAKHASARHCSVTIRNGSAESERSLVFFVTDDGIGFDTKSENAPRAIQPHFGLQSMKSRAELIGAKFEINSEPNDGTEIRIELAI